MELADVEPALEEVRPERRRPCRLGEDLHEVVGLGPLEGLAHRRHATPFLPACALKNPWVSAKANDRVGDPVERQHLVGEPGLHDGARHAPHGGRRLVLRDDHAAVRLDGLAALAPVDAHAGEDHGEHPVAPHGGDGLEGDVGGGPHAVDRRQRRELDAPREGRDEVEVAGGDERLVVGDEVVAGGLVDRHGPGRVEAAGERGGEPGRHVLDEQDAGVDVGRQLGHDRGEGRGAAGRGGDDDEPPGRDGSDPDDAGRGGGDDRCGPCGGPARGAVAVREEGGLGHGRGGADLGDEVLADAPDIDRQGSARLGDEVDGPGVEGIEGDGGALGRQAREHDDARRRLDHEAPEHARDRRARASPRRA